jgi:hypothetical protein
MGTEIQTGPTGRTLLPLSIAGSPAGGSGAAGGVGYTAGGAGGAG